MQLHRHIPNHELPAVLRLPLEFGNREQINALAEIEARIIDREELKRKLKAGELTEYCVTFHATDSVYVSAENAKQAKILAWEQFCSLDGDWEIDDVWPRK